MTGIGLRTPLGCDSEEVLDALERTRSAACAIPDLVAEGIPVTSGCPVPPFDATAYVGQAQVRHLDRATLLAVAAAVDAVGADPLTEVAEPERIGVCVGIGGGGLSTSEAICRDYASRPTAVPAFVVPRIMVSAAAARISLRNGAQGPALTYSSACASGANAVGEAALKIRAGQLDMALAGGTEAILTPLVMAAFANLRILSRRNEDPAAACRPFDADRDGTVLGEGAAFLLLEAWEHAVARGARIWGEILGYGSTADAFHIVAPGEDGVVAARSMSLALADAGLSPGDVRHINAHGTATRLNDRSEALAIRQVFGSDCPPVTASKAVLGHLLGAAGAAEVAIALLMAEREVIAPIGNLTQPDPDVGYLDLVVAGPRKTMRGPALSNSFGFGGHNVTLVVAPA